ncbi:MAG: type II secretion system protein GspN [Thermodesulfobacteriota bacterium]
MIMTTTKKWAAYIAYTVLVTVLFLYLLFPSDTVKSYIGHRLAGLAPEISFDIDTLYPRIPPGLAVKNADVTYQNNPAVTLTQLSVQPAYLSLLGAEPAVNFNGRLADGTLSGRAGLQTGTENQAIATELTFDGIELKKIPLIETLSPHRFSGQAAGEIQHQTQAGSWGTGRGTVRLTECRVVFNRSILGIDELQFDRIAAEAKIENQRVEVTQIQFDGSMLSGSGKGSLQMRQPIENSRIDLTGSIKPHAELLKSAGGLIPKRYMDEGGIPVRITGTLNRPDFSLR